MTILTCINSTVSFFLSKQRTEKDRIEAFCSIEEIGERMQIEHFWEGGEYSKIYSIKFTVLSF